jgi:hypothetical protein
VGRAARTAAARRLPLHEARRPRQAVLPLHEARGVRPTGADHRELTRARRRHARRPKRAQRPRNPGQVPRPRGGPAALRRLMYQRAELRLITSDEPLASRERISTVSRFTHQTATWSSSELRRRRASVPGLPTVAERETFVRGRRCPRRAFRARANRLAPIRRAWPSPETAPPPGSGRGARARGSSPRRSCRRPRCPTGARRTNRPRSRPSAHPARPCCPAPR